MNAHALDVLELSRALALVAERAVAGLAAQRIRNTQPTSDRRIIDHELARVSAARTLSTSEHPWSPEATPDLVRPLQRLGIPGAPWTGLELRGALTLLGASRRTRDTLSDERRPPVARAVLADVRERLVGKVDAERSIDRAIAEDGTVRDEASPLLRRVRRELRGAEGELVALLERIMSRLEAHQQVGDASVTVRNGRYVIPIRREARTVVGGIVQDTSATGATLFVEPPAAVEAGNRIRELEAEERREVDRILADLTDELRPLAPALQETLDALVDLDTLHARARFADDFHCTVPDLGSPTDGFVIRQGRHPLLLAQDVPVVPFDLTMEPSERTLLISGPNTGGKTVLLKSVALCSVLVQCGIPSPVGPASRIAVFDDVFADVGDEQSIQASLSTFSAHVRNLGDILARATPKSLVLIDELGSGTDPLEGAALGGAVLEALTARGTMTLATTHLGALKELATEVPGVVNGSLEFDAARLAPTYRFIKGVPGRSYGLRIARRLALPEEVIARAEERVPKVERDVEALLADLQQRASDLAEREQTAAQSLANASDRSTRVDARERAVREREREVERRSRQEARQYLLNARAQIEQVVRDLQAAPSRSDDTTEEARRARQRVEQLAGEQAQALADLDAAAASPPPAQEAPRARPSVLAVGDTVEVPLLGGRAARLVDLHDEEAVVAFGGMRMRVPASTLRRAAQAAPQIAVPVAAEVPEIHASSEIDVRGMRVLEVEEIVMQAIDAAVRADLPELRIIHGKGTGALRERVGEMLRKDSRVRVVRLGAWNEGGAGVTVAELA